jgi:hypothetical protein
VKQEFAQVPRSFFSQISACIKKGHLVSLDRHPELPKDFLAQSPKTDARFAFFAGERNRCFLPESQVKSFEYLNSLRPDYHSLHLIPGYGHLDIFMGKAAVKDVFPLMLAELDKPN